MPARRWIWRGAVGALAAALISMVVIHLPPVRGYLAARGHRGGGVCPLGYGAGSTAASREARRAHNAAVRGDRPAHTRPALGFALDVTTAADIARWAADHGVRCTAQHGGTAFECADVPGSLAPGGSALALTSLWLQIGAHGTLDAIRTVRRDPNVGAVASAFAATEHALTTSAGEPVHHDGSAAPDVLAAGALSQATVEYRFTDYRAVVRATNMGNGFLLTEDYSTLID